MRASREVPRLPAVMTTEGRLLPFDRGRLATSLGRALAPGPVRPEDLVSVVAAWLARDDQPPVVGASELSALAARVLVAAGDPAAAQRYGARRGYSPLRRVSALTPLTSVESGSGPEAEQRLARRVVSERVLAGLLPDAVVEAEALGLLRLTAAEGAARVPAARLPASWLAAHRGQDLGATLRRLAGNVSHELLVPWTGRPPTPRELGDLLRHLRGATIGPVVLALSSERSGSLGRLTEVLACEQGAPLSLRVVGPLVGPLRGPASWSSTDMAGHHPAVQRAPTLPAPGLVLGAVGLDLLALARHSHSDTSETLRWLETLARLGLSALSGLVGAGLDAGACAELAPHSGHARRLQVRLAHAAAAEALLLGPRVAALASDLSASVGERLRRAAVAEVGSDLAVEIVLDHAAGFDRESEVDDPSLAHVERRLRLGVAHHDPLPMPLSSAAAARLASAVVSAPLTPGTRTCV